MHDAQVVRALGNQSRITIAAYPPQSSNDPLSSLPYPVPNVHADPLNVLLGESASMHCDVSKKSERSRSRQSRDFGLSAVVDDCFCKLESLGKPVQRASSWERKYDTEYRKSRPTGPADRERRALLGFSTERCSGLRFGNLFWRSVQKCEIPGLNHSACVEPGSFMI